MLRILRPTRLSNPLALAVRFLVVMAILLVTSLPASQSAAASAEQDCEAAIHAVAGGGAQHGDHRATAPVSHCGVACPMHAALTPVAPEPDAHGVPFAATIAVAPALSGLPPSATERPPRLLPV